MLENQYRMIFSSVQCGNAGELFSEDGWKGGGRGAKEQVGSTKCGTSLKIVSY